MNDNHTTSLLEQGYIHARASFLMDHESVRKMVENDDTHKKRKITTCKISGIQNTCKAFSRSLNRPVIYELPRNITEKTLIPSDHGVHSLTLY